MVRCSATDLHLADEDLQTIVRLVQSRSGIALHDGKRALVIARLQKRVRAGGFRSFAEYVRFVTRDDTGEELVLLLDAIATNHTAFFREPQHFDLLSSHVVPSLVRGGVSPIEGWCAACATGEEAYTMAMTAMDAVPAAGSPPVRVFASDLSTRALATARQGVYAMTRVRQLPRELLRRHFERGLGEQAGLARIGARVRAAVDFERVNLLEIDDLGRRFPFIFCRNVLIYFDRAAQQQVVAMLERHLLPGGYLFVSHSESLNTIRHRLTWVAPAVYRRGLR
jgi:chemotaxis protein methyltransferase CheR